MKRLTLGAAALVACALLAGEARAADCSQTKASAATSAAELELLGKLCKAVSGAALDASAMTPVAAEALVLNTRSTAAQPAAGRPASLILRGTGQVTGAPVYSYDGGTTWVYRTAAVDGAPPIVIGKVAYDGSVLANIEIPVSSSVAGYRVAFLPTSVTGTVTVEPKQ